MDLRSRPLPRAALLLPLVPVLSAGHAAAQLGTPPRVLVSTTSDLAPVNGLPALSDAAVVAVGGTDVPVAHFTDGHWQGTVGFVPTDVDGLARVPGTPPGSNASFAFSLLSDEAGFRDGDVLAFDGGGGVSVVVPEDDILNGLGVPQANVDLDAIAFDDLGLLVFSLQSDLDGTVLGTVEDGDVLRLEADLSVTRVLSEAEVQARFTTATGSTAAIGDVNGLEWVQGDPWVTTQGPSAWDGAVIAVGNSPIVLADESYVGLGGAELDALSYVRPGDEIASVAFDATTLSEGDGFHAVVHGSPGGTYVAFMAGTTGILPTPSLPGFGTLYMDVSDAWFQQGLANLTASVVTLDSTGAFGLDYTLPTAALWGLGFGGEEGWSFQLLDAGTLELSAPVRIVRG